MRKFLLRPQGIVTGPDHNLWFALDTAPSDAVVRMTPGGQVIQFPIPNGTNVLPTDLTVGPDRDLWFTEEANIVGRITTSGAFVSLPRGDAALTRRAKRYSAR